jgi:hypothetical protein
MKILANGNLTVKGTFKMREIVQDKILLLVSECVSLCIYAALSRILYYLSSICNSFLLGGTHPIKPELNFREKNRLNVPTALTNKQPLNIHRGHQELTEF